MPKLDDELQIAIRDYEKNDFESIQQLNAQEGWSNLVEKRENTEKAWECSSIAYVAENGDQQVIGYIRGLTDGFVSMFICELLVEVPYRGLGIGKKLLDFAHSQHPHTRLELLASASSSAFYEKYAFRPFYGFRKTFSE